ncbi:MAG: GIY-YIG nuclease family protein [Candidatus Dormibacteraeota bacterium]|nr:GIY-YIG nuclease family protein [Candidatus Dormibacteraeota bacterium]
MTTLYRFYDRRGDLLYVGISLGFLIRWGQHRDKEWWHQIARSTLQHFPSRELALAAESLAIRDEHPRFNIKGRGADETLNLRDEADALTVLFGYPDDREPECCFDATGLAVSIDWDRQRLRSALNRLRAKGRIALRYLEGGAGHAVLQP